MNQKVIQTQLVVKSKLEVNRIIARDCRAKMCRTDLSLDFDYVRKNGRADPGSKSRLFYGWLMATYESVLRFRRFGFVFTHLLNFDIPAAII